MLRKGGKTHHHTKETNLMHMAYFDSTTKIDFTKTAQHGKHHQSHTNSSEYFRMDRT